MEIGFSHIIFDWDGTLMDSAGKIVSCMQKAAERSQLNIPSASQVHDIIGISLVPAIARLFAVNQTHATEIAKHYKQIFIENDQTPSPLFDGVEQGLHLLEKSCVLGVATGKARRGLERAWESTNTKHYFTDSVCADEAESKPSPDMLLQLLDRWQAQPQDVLMVGDTEYDMQMAEAIGMPRLGVSYGVHSVDRIAKHNPIAIIDKFEDFIPALTQ